MLIRRIAILGLALALFPATTHAQEVVPKGDRILGIDALGVAENENYDTTFGVALEAGLEDISLSWDWQDIEIAPGEYDNTWLNIANTYYAAYGVSTTLTIRPLHTNTKPVPEDLKDTQFDDPVMIERFNAMIDNVLAQFPDLHLTSLAIGSEFDIYLGTDAASWGQYTVFCAAVKAHIKTNYPDLPIAFEASFTGITGDSGPYIQTLNALSDIVAVSYYPLQPDFTPYPPEIVHTDFDTLTALYPGRIIHFFQLGYPSSEILNSSEAQQAQFIEEVFKAWDTHADQIKLIDFTWLTESSPATVKGFEDYYGLHNERFAAFLGSLGLRTSQGEPKAALQTLTHEAEIRGW